MYCEMDRGERVQQEQTAAEVGLYDNFNCRNLTLGLRGSNFVYFNRLATQNLVTDDEFNRNPILTPILALVAI